MLGKDYKLFQRIPILIFWTFRYDSNSSNDSAASTSSNPFASPDGGFVYGEVVNPFSGMTKDEDIPAADQSLEGMINEAFGTVR